jgi:hypothetical protein
MNIELGDDWYNSRDLSVESISLTLSRFESSTLRWASVISSFYFGSCFVVRNCLCTLGNVLV